MVSSNNRRFMLLSITVVTLFSIIGFMVVVAQEDPPQQPEAFPSRDSATATVQDVDGNEIGLVTFLQQPNGKVVVIAELSNLSPGFHGFHVHEVGECDPNTEEPFSSAGDHLALEGQDHPDHTGDLPPVLVNQDGTAMMVVLTDRFTVEDLLDDDGSAIIIHENPNNFAHIPDRYGVQPDETTISTGDAGTPIACGVVMVGVGEGAVG